MLADMPLPELFEWYQFHLDQWGVKDAEPAGDVVASVDEEIAMMKAAFGGRSGN